MSLANVIEAHPDFTNASVRQQLFRYAQDLQDLMAQQLELQDRYRTVLEFLGHGLPDEDALAAALFKGNACHLSTTATGELLAVENASLTFKPVTQWVVSKTSISRLEASESRGVFQSVLDKFASFEELGGLELRHVTLVLPGLPNAELPFDLLAFQSRIRGQRVVNWLLQPAQLVGSTGAQSLGSFMHASISEYGLVATEPDGTIVDANATMTRITGYGHDELRGKNPRIYGSGHHPAAFFHDFWLGLLDNGRWNGHILNRRKDGSIFLSWQSIRMIEDSEGRVIGYMSAIFDMSPRSDAANSPNDPMHDPITGITNRRHFEELAAQAINVARHNEQTMAILFLEVTGFKQMGEDFGFSFGDQLRRQLGRRLKAIERPGLLLAQLGSDEFVLLLQGDPSEGEIMATANTALAVSTSAFRISGRNVYMDANVGCSMYPRDGRTMHALLECADTAMFGAKQFNRRFSFYESESLGV